MKKLELRGIIPPIVTPLLSDDTLDKEGAVRIIENMIAGGVHGIFVLGTTGESQSLSFQCRCDMVELTVRQVAGRIPVLAGISDTSIGESVRLAEFAKKCGAAAVVATPPYYYAPSQEELIGYYTALADAVPLPLYLYNMPSHVKVSIEPSTAVALAKHPNILGLKDSSANMSYFQTLIQLTRGQSFDLYMGPEELTGEAVLAGAAGAVNGGANMFPELYVAMYDAATKGDIDTMRKLQRRIMEISTTVYTVKGSYLRGLKCAMSLMGLCSGHLAYPFRQFEQADRDKIREALVNLGIKVVG